jgi:Tfp pilus assembly protein FimT
VKQQRAFTLVEAVLVIVLTLILTSASIGGLVGVQNWRGNSAVRRFQADALYARNVAITSTRRVMCVISTGTTYELQQEAAPGSGAVVATAMNHPLTDQAWRVNLGDLRSGLSVTVQPSLTPVEFGFNLDGRLIRRNGSVMQSDVVVTFNNGAVATLRAGSGLCEVQWP